MYSSDGFPQTSPPVSTPRRIHLSIWPSISLFSALFAGLLCVVPVWAEGPNQISLTELLAAPAWKPAPLAQESVVGAPTGPYPRTQLLEQAARYRDYRRGRLSPLQTALWDADCQARPGDSPFCPVTLSTTSENISGRRGQPAPLSEVEARGHLADGSWKKLDEVGEGALHRALRGMPVEGPWLTEVDSWAESSRCASTAVYVAVAQKLEEAFPDELQVKRARALFRNAIRCASRDSERANADGSLPKARFRYALLSFWAGDVRETELALRPLTQGPETDFTSRAVYWRVRALNLLGDRVRASALSGRLKARHPMSLHALVIQGGKNSGSARAHRQPGRSSPWSKPVLVSRRTSHQAHLNWIFAAAESLWEVGAPELATEFLGAKVADLEGTDPESRLYAAALLQKGGAYLASFRLVGGILREKPSLFGQDTLRLFYPKDLLPLLSRHASRVEPLLSLSLIRQESGFQPQARSRVGALGLMQLMPDTARRVAGGRMKHSLFQPDWNVRLGTRYLGTLMDQFGGDVDLALAAYNAGPDKVSDWLRRYPVGDRLLFLDLIPFAETRNYVALIARNYFWYQHVYRDDPSLGSRARVVASEGSVSSDVRSDSIKQVFPWLKIR